MDQLLRVLEMRARRAEVTFTIRACRARAALVEKGLIKGPAYVRLRVASVHRWWAGRRVPQPSRERPAAGQLTHSPANDASSLRSLRLPSAKRHAARQLFLVRLVIPIPSHQRRVTPVLKDQQCLRRFNVPIAKHRVDSALMPWGSVPVFVRQAIQVVVDDRHHLTWDGHFALGHRRRQRARR